MSNTTKKEQVTAMIKSILENKPETRDNDMYLAAVIWYDRCGQKYNRSEVSFTDFMHILRNYQNEGIPTFETISRIRRLLQEKYPHLRGLKYAERQAKQQEVIKDILDFKQNHDAQRPDETLLNGQQQSFNG